MRRAFSLLEILIGVLVLALGLLGLGVVIPIVVREQKIAGDVAMGAICAGDALSGLWSRPGFDPGALPGPAPAGLTAWDVWIRDTNWSGPSTSPQRAGLWETWDDELNANTGDFVWRDDSTSPPTIRVLTLADRLWPGPASRPARASPAGTDPHRPRFVWDIVGRRAAFGDLYARQFSPGSPEYQAWLGQPDVVQIAIFVRRVDMNIRVPRRAGVTLHDVLTGAGNVTAAERRWPVAVDSTGWPAGDGRGEYARPITLEVTFDPAERDRIELLSGSAIERRLAGQAGQKIVDNLGNVYTVVPFDTRHNEPTTEWELRLDRPIPGWVPDPAMGSAQTVRQIVFVPQVPAAVVVFTITRPVGVP